MITQLKLQHLRMRCDNAERRGPNVTPHLSVKEVRELIHAIESIAAPAPVAQQGGQPVAWVDIDKGVIVGVPRLYSDGSQDEIPLYTAAPAPQPAQDALQEIAAYIGVGGYNGADAVQLTARIKAEFDRLTALQSAQPVAPPLCELCTEDGQCMHRSILCIIKRPGVAKAAL